MAALTGGAEPWERQTFTVVLSVLSRLREYVADHGRACGLPQARVNDLVLIANELTSNVVRHGGGTGELRLWADGRAVYCEVSDRGGGIADVARAGHAQSRPEALTGRGLWMIRQLGDDVAIASGPRGTTVTVALSRPATDDGAAGPGA